jgi:hypothetical protein
LRRLVVAAIVAALGSVVTTTVACKNDRTDQQQYIPPSGPPPSQTATAVATDDTTQATSTATAFHPENEYAPDVMVVGVDTTLVPGSATPPPPPDPFAPAIESVRASALSCFAPLPPGTYASTIVVRVTPAGTPVDVQVDPGNVQDPSVLGCLQQAGEARSYPSSPDGRTLRIYVRVTG